MPKAVAGGGAVLSPASVRGAICLRRRVRRAPELLRPDLFAELPDGLPQLGEGLRQEPQGQANRCHQDTDFECAYRHVHHRIGFARGPAEVPDRRRFAVDAGRPNGTVAIRWLGFPYRG